MAESPEQHDATKIHTSAQPQDSRKGAFISDGTVYGNIIGYQETHLPPSPQAMPLDKALGLLAELPLDKVPEPQTLPTPHRLPFASNRLFVGRTDDLAQIAAQLKAGGALAVTTGIGGVGKTQLAIEAGHRYGRYFGGGVFWLSFADPGAIATEVADCGRRMCAFHDAERLDLEGQVQRTEMHWADDLPRLLIFDNCEDEALLRRWQPKTGGCRVLVTSRKQTAWSPDLNLSLLPLDVLPRPDSIRLLRQIVQRLSEQEADQIAAELGDLPLALHLAGCYLRLYRIPVNDYLSKLRRPDLLEHASLTGRGVKGMPTEREPHVARAFALSFERLEQTDPTDALARQLLARAACFAPGEPFQREWLEQTIESEGDQEAQLLDCTDALERVLGLGLLEPVGREEVRMHRLLGVYATQTIQDPAALSSVEQALLYLSHKANMTGLPAKMRPFLPHLRTLIHQAQAAQRENDYTADLCNNLGYHFKSAGDYAAAMPLYQQSLAINERVCGPMHPQTAKSLNNLAMLYLSQGIYKQAQILVERALEIYLQVLGKAHLWTAVSLNNLAQIYLEQAMYDQARLLLEDALVIHTELLGRDHPSTATSLNNLGYLYCQQGAYDRARPLYEEALALRKHLHGTNHPDTATSMNNLAGLYVRQGAFARALPLYEQALAIRKHNLGPDHPDTIEMLGNLAALYLGQGKADQAQLLLEQILASEKVPSGGKHPDSLHGLHTMAVGLMVQGREAIAMLLLEQARDIWQQRLGCYHPKTVHAQLELATLQRYATLPDAVRAILQAPDQAHAEQQLRDLSPEDAEATRQHYVAFQPHTYLDLFEPLFKAITEVAQGDDRPRAEVEIALADLNQHALGLTSIVGALWAGERDPAVLTAGLDEPYATLIRRTVALLADAEAIDSRAALLARCEAAVAAAGADPADRAELAERLHTAAMVYARGDAQDQTLAARLRALADRLG
ncbi:MAG TPA: tetratricopeptide repeat protein [Roseiflexaceae bacterium]|nr:tetratricopeptide repeat protein [Roseiflexaceae bacterium]